MPDLSHREKELRASFEKDKETFKPGERVEVPLRMSPPIRRAPPHWTSFHR